MPNYFEVMDNYKEKKEREIHEKSYKDIIGNKDTILAEELKIQAEKVINLLNEEIDMTERGYSFENTKGLDKYNKLRKLAKKKEQAETTKIILSELVKKFEPEKRGPGRTRKDGSPARSKKLQQLEEEAKTDKQEQSPKVASSTKKDKPVQKTTELEGGKPQDKHPDAKQQQLTTQDDVPEDTKEGDTDVTDT